MLWITLAWSISLIAAYLLGFYLHTVKKRIEVLEEIVKTKVDKKPIIEEPKSQLIDPSDPIQTAIYEHQKEMERLNPQ